MAPHKDLGQPKWVQSARCRAVADVVEYLGRGGSLPATGEDVCRAGDSAPEFAVVFNPEDGTALVRFMDGHEVTIRPATLPGPGTYRAAP